MHRHLQWNSRPSVDLHQRNELSIVSTEMFRSLALRRCKKMYYTSAKSFLAAFSNLVQSIQSTVSTFTENSI